jgi:hypothetical protein
MACMHLKLRFWGPFSKSKTQESSGDNENAILWTPLLITFAQTDMVGP